MELPESCELCELCTDYNACRRTKRLETNILAPCPEHILVEGLSPEIYRQIQVVVQRAYEEGVKAAGPQTVIPNDIVTAVTTEDYWPAAGLPPELFIDFAQCNFADEKERDGFVSKFGDADVLIFNGACCPDHPSHPELVAVQNELDLVMNTYTTSGVGALCKGYVNSVDRTEMNPLDVLNKWLGRLDFQLRPYPVFSNQKDQEEYELPYRVSKGKVERDEQGKRVSVRSILSQVEENRLNQEVDAEVIQLNEGSGPMAWRVGVSFKDAELRLVPHLVVRQAEEGSCLAPNQYALLFHQCANVILSKEQDLKRCPNPNCKTYFMPPDRINAGPTCGRNACKLWASRNNT